MAILVLSSVERQGCSKKFDLVCKNRLSGK